MFKAGDRVIHPLFGAGVVRAISGSGDQARINVDFAPSVGQKTLLASLAKLSKSGDAESNPGTAPVGSAWFEVCDAEFALKRGRRPAFEPLRQALRAEPLRHDFWTELRDRLRSTGKAPRVLDSPSGQLSLSVSISGNPQRLSLKVSVKHAELIRSNDAILAQTLTALLAERLLQDFDPGRRQSRIEVSGTLVEADVIDLNESPDPGPLPDRTPLRRPKPVAPKGQIRSMPRRRDDY